MRFFTPAEFGEWWPMMHATTLDCFDAFRHYWGAPVNISPQPMALGRHMGPRKISGHNVDYWKAVMAGDAFPAGMDSAEAMARAYDCARKAKATGIGFYTDTSPSFMIHLDTRPDRSPDKPRLWSRVNGKYRAISVVMPKGWKR